MIVNNFDFDLYWSDLTFETQQEIRAMFDAAKIDIPGAVQESKHPFYHCYIGENTYETEEKHPL